MRALNLNELSFVSGGVAAIDLGDDFTMTLDFRPPPAGNTGSAGGATYKIDVTSIPLNNPGPPQTTPVVTLTGTGRDAAQIMNNLVGGLQNMVNNAGSVIARVASIVLQFFDWLFNGIQRALSISGNVHMNIE